MADTKEVIRRETKRITDVTNAGHGRGMELATRGMDVSTSRAVGDVSASRAVGDFSSGRGMGDVSSTRRLDFSSTRGMDSSNALMRGVGVGGAAGGALTSKSYIQVYLRELQENPLRTKMLTSGTLSALQEILASIIAGDRNRHGSYITPRVPKMAVYGAFISAPLGHVLVTLLQKAFAGRTSTKAKFGQVLVSNLLVSPIQNTVYLACMAVIAGARKFHQVRATVKAGFMPVMKVSWCTSPLALLFAQKFLPPQAWVPFFNLVGFVIGTYINATTKKKRISAIKKKKLQEEKKDTYYRSEYRSEVRRE